MISSGNTSAESESDGGEDFTDGEGGITDEEGSQPCSGRRRPHSGSQNSTGSTSLCTQEEGDPHSSGELQLSAQGSGSVTLAGTHAGMSPRLRMVTGLPSSPRRPLSSSFSTGEDSTAATGEARIEQRTHARTHSSSMTKYGAMESTEEDHTVGQHGANRQRHLTFSSISPDEERSSKRKEKKEKQGKKKEKKDKKERKEKQSPLPFKAGKLVLSPRGKRKETKEIKEAHQDGFDPSNQSRASSQMGTLAPAALSVETSNAAPRSSPRLVSSMPSPPSIRDSGDTGEVGSGQTETNQSPKSEMASSQEQAETDRQIGSPHSVDVDVEKAFGTDSAAITLKGSTDELTGSERDRPVRMRRSFSGSLPSGTFPL